MGVRRRGEGIRLSLMKNVTRNILEETESYKKTIPIKILAV
jgi:hypothetical protein